MVDDIFSSPVARVQLQLRMGQTQNANTIRKFASMSGQAAIEKMMAVNKLLSGPVSLTPTATT